MIPAKTHPVWATLVKGKAEHQFKSATASMFFHRIRGQFQKDPGRFDALVEEARVFVSKCEGILGDDIKNLFG